MSKREHLWAAFWLLLATAACLSRLVQYPADVFVGPQDHGLNDVTRQVIASRTILSTGVRLTKQLPLWNPWTMGGAPWFGNPQSGVLYPPNWLYFWVPEVDCVNWLVFAHHWWAGLGTYLLARKFGLSWLASLGAGIFFLGAPYMLAQTCEGHVSQVCLMSWAPWLWLAFERIRSRAAGGIPGAALVMSLAFFCGHVQELYYLVLMFSLFAVWDFVFSRGASGQRPWWIPVNWFAAGLLTGGMVAAEFLTVWIYLRQAVRATGISVAQASQGTLELRSLWQLLDPLAYGGPQNSLQPDSYAWGMYWESIFYFGIGPLLLAIWGVCRGPRRYPSGRLVGIAVLAILFSFGDKTPLFPVLHQYVPGIGMFRAPMRALFHASFAVALLGGIGLDVLLSSVGQEQEILRRRAWTFWGWIFVIAGVGLGLSLARLAPFELVLGKWPQIHWLWVFGYGIAVSFSLLMGLYVWNYRYFWSSACLLVCLTDLALHGRAVTDTIPMSTWRQTNPIVDRVRGDIGLSRLSAPQVLVSDREAWQHGVHKIQAYEPLPLVLWGEFLAVLCPREDPATTLTGFTPLPMAPFNGALLDLLGVRYAAVTGHAEPPRTGWRLIERGQIPEESTLRGARRRLIPYSLLENQQPMPRAYVVYHARRVKNREQVKAALRTFDPRTEVIVDARFPEIPTTASGLEFTPVEITQHSPNQIVLNLPQLKQPKDQPAFLCLTDLYYPGWSATRKGNAVEIHPGNMSFRVIPLSTNEPGEVVLNFVPPGARLGCIISGLAWMIWIVWVVRGLRSSSVTLARSVAV